MNIYKKKVFLSFVFTNICFIFQNITEYVTLYLFLKNGSERQLYDCSFMRQFSDNVLLNSSVYQLRRSQRQMFYVDSELAMLIKCTQTKTMEEKMCMYEKSKINDFQIRYKYFLYFLRLKKKRPLMLFHPFFFFYSHEST